MRTSFSVETNWTLLEVDGQSGEDGLKSACRGQTPKSGSDIERQPKEVGAPVPHLSIPGHSSHLSPFLLAGLDVGLQRRVSANAWLASGRIHDSRDTKEKRRFDHELDDDTSFGRPVADRPTVSTAVDGRR